VAARIGASLPPALRAPYLAAALPADPAPVPEAVADGR
jgi:hypothetical protein